MTAAHQAKAEQIAELAEFSETGEEHLVFFTQCCNRELETALFLERIGDWRR